MLLDKDLQNKSSISLESAMKNYIRVKGANEHNLKNISVDIPKNSLVVITGLSGSGKSSLAFDTIYAEGQRRFLEGLSSFSRQYMVQFKKPEVESIQGLTPAIAIEQKTTNTSPRSTVGTITGIYDFLRLLYAKVGTPKCPVHGLDVKSSDTETVLGQLLKSHIGQKIQILAPVASQKKGEFQKELRYWESKGFLKAYIDGKWIEISEITKLAKTKPHDIDVLVDQLPVEEKFSHRIKSSLNRAFDIASGLVSIVYLDTNEKVLFSLDSSCPKCGYSFPELDPNHFSFNNPRGACEECKGLGTTDIQEESQILDGLDGQKSQVTKFKYKGQDAHSDEDDEIPTHLRPCESCNGTRLNLKARSVFIGEKNIADLSLYSLSKLRQFLSELKLSGRDLELGEKIINQILTRLAYIENIGAGYLSLSRSSATLSGGESQRIRLATQLGASMVGVLYVLDEPSIGLHPRDHHKLLNHLNEIKNRGNTIIVVEHDEETMENADFIVDIGPRAGEFGGEIQATGNLESIKKNPQSLTGQYLSYQKTIPYPESRREKQKSDLVLKKASGHNLKDVDVTFPLGLLIGVSGISGSGKSTLIIDTLYPALSEKVYGFDKYSEPYQSLEGFEDIDKVIQINQNPIGRTPRSTPATYVGLFPLIRDLFARLPDAKMRGFKPGHFSFNVKGGRCETCKGHGQVKIEMHFLADVYVPCEECRGRRYNGSVLNIKFKDQNIADILEMSVSDACEFFKNQGQIFVKLKTLEEVGLGYLRLGQSSLTLSGGEAQRVKLSRELSKRATGKTFYILDEPTTGLHFEDIKKLIELLHRLADQGNTVLVIEHNMDVLKNCDHIIELGPEGGEQGGLVTFQGSPEELSKSKTSFTAPFLKKSLSLNSKPVS